MEASRATKPPKCTFPQSHATARPIADELRSIATQSSCSSFYLDTVEGMSNDAPWTEGEDHHQGLARSHLLSDGSICWFLSHSELDEGDQGSVSCYLYRGPTNGQHVVTTHPLTVAPRHDIEMLVEQHPSDIVFLPDVQDADSGYLFVAEEFDAHVVSVHRWDRHDGLHRIGLIPQGLPNNGPAFLFLDRLHDDFYLGIASIKWGWGQLLVAPAEDLFPGCRRGMLELSAFEPVGMFPFPVLDACQVKLVRDATGNWFLLGYRSDPSSDEHGADYVDVYGVRFEPFGIGPLILSQHVTFPAGDTGFANTGTHHVEPSGRLLVSSSYRWAEDEGPGDSSYVSRVDECASG